MKEERRKIVSHAKDLAIGESHALTRIFPTLICRARNEREGLDTRKHENFFALLFQ
jgi:hypothetical protein